MRASNKPGNVLALAAVMKSPMAESQSEGGTDASSVDGSCATVPLKMAGPSLPHPP
jgi:hypothetical protein